MNIHCDNCGAGGHRRWGQITPDGWYFAEIVDEEDDDDVTFTYACSKKCCVMTWKAGPGSLQDPAPPRYPASPANPAREPSAAPGEVTWRDLTWRDLTGALLLLFFDRFYRD
jgi:hypothetical protein